MLIVTLATQRSGTKFLGSLFKTGSEIQSLAELFNPDEKIPFSFRTFLQALGLNQIIDEGSELVLDRFFAGLLGAFPRLHFDMMYNQLEIPCISWNPYYGPFFYNYLKARSAVVISLRRLPLECYLSARRVIRGGRAHAFEVDGDGQEEGLLIEPEDDFDTEEFCSYEKGIQTYLAEIEREFKDYELFIRLDYEELAARGYIGGDLIRLLIKGARMHGVTLDKTRIQMAPSPYRRLSTSSSG